MGASGGDLPEVVVAVDLLTGLVAAPALYPFVEVDPAAMPGSGGYLHKRAQWGAGLIFFVESPAMDIVVGGDSAGMKAAGVDLRDDAFGVLRPLVSRMLDGIAKLTLVIRVFVALGVALAIDKAAVGVGGAGFTCSAGATALRRTAQPVVAICGRIRKGALFGFLDGDFFVGAFEVGIAVSRDGETSPLSCFRTDNSL